MTPKRMSMRKPRSPSKTQSSPKVTMTPRTRSPRRREKPNDVYGYVISSRYLGGVGGGRVVEGD